MEIRSALSLNHFLPLKLFSVTPRHLTPAYARGFPSGMTRMTTMGERRILRMSPRLTVSENPVMFWACIERVVRYPVR